LNGVSVSKSAKIGERPYPSPFHPVEIPSKSCKFRGSRGQITTKIPKPAPLTPNTRQLPSTKIQFTRS